MDSSLVKKIFEVSEQVPQRNMYQVLAYLMEEVGELATEVSIQQKYSDKKAEPYSFLAEGVDVITCVVDLLWVAYGDCYTHEELEQMIMNMLQLKLDKWKRKKTQELS